jgi:hypothetical protein
LVENKEAISTQQSGLSALKNTFNCQHCQNCQTLRIGRIGPGSLTTEKEQLANGKWQLAESKRAYPLPGSTVSTDEIKDLAAIEPTVNRPETPPKALSEPHH